MLEERQLTKRFRRQAVVDTDAFFIYPVVLLACLGPNGSGKSTTVRMLTGLLPPSDGQVLFCSQPVDNDPTEFRRRFGYVPEEPYLYTHLSGREYLQLI